MGEDRVLTETARGDRMYLDTKDLIITPQILCAGTFEDKTVALFDRILKPGMVWADIGANCGYFTVIGHRLVLGPDGAANGQTFAFEVSPTSYQLCLDNLIANCILRGARVERQAVFAENRQSVRLTVLRKYGGNSGAVTLLPERAHYLGEDISHIDVPATSIDNYFLGRGRLPDFIKIDIEGGEFDALQGARRLIAQKPDLRFIIEWSPVFMIAREVEPRAFIELLAEFGFNCFNADAEMRPMTAADCLALAGTTMLFLSRSGPG